MDPIEKKVEKLKRLFPKMTTDEARRRVLSAPRRQAAGLQAAQEEREAQEMVREQMQRFIDRQNQHSRQLAEQERLADERRWKAAYEAQASERRYRQELYVSSGAAERFRKANPNLFGDKAPMTENKKPTHRVVWTDRKTKEKITVMTGWPNQFDGVNLSPSRGFTSQANKTYPGVVKIEATLDDGTVLDMAGFFAELKANEVR